MKYALIIPNLSCGGAEKAMIRLAAALQARGHSVHLILLRSGEGHEIAPDIRVHRLFHSDKPKRGGSLGKALAAYRLRQLHHQLTITTPFDVVISTLPFADHIVHLAKLPNVWYRIANTLSEEVSDLNKISIRKGHKRLKRIRSLYAGKNLIVNSEGVGRDLVEKLGVQAARIEVISNYIDVADITRLSFQHDPEIPAQPFIIHVGRFSPAKRHDVLLHAWKIADLPCRLVLLVKPTPKLLKLIKSQGVEDSVIVAGFKTNPFPWIKAARLLVLSSEREGLPNVLLESLWMNTPVISTDCPSGPREILEFDPDRYLTPVNDPQALGRKMRELWDQPFQTPPEFQLKYSPRLSLEKYESLGMKPA
jgi:glycosyltransferase involved in cell wall biosynthesis